MAWAKLGLRIEIVVVSQQAFDDLGAGLDCWSFGRIEADERRRLRVDRVVQRAAMPCVLGLLGRDAAGRPKPADERS
jgi:hypothetical protein